MSSKYVLYSYWRSSCSWRVRAVLEHKNIPYEYKAVNLYTGEQNSEEFRKICPSGMVPTLQFETQDGKPVHLFESMAIVDYLEQIHPDCSVYPKDVLERAKVLTVVNTVVSATQTLQNLGVMKIIKEWTNSKEKSVEWSNYWICNRFDYLEKYISQTSGKYTVGDQLTLADICLVPQVYNALRYNVNIDKYPTIKRLYEALMNEPGPISQSKPENQPDKQ